LANSPCQSQTALKQYHINDAKFTDFTCVMAETEDDLITRLNEWKDNMENRVMRVNMNKTKVMIQ